MRLENQYNFLRWTSSETEAEDITDINNGYISDPARCPYKPVLVAGEAMRFYINTLTGLSSFITDPSGVKLKLVKAKDDSIFSEDISPLQLDTILTTDFTFYSEVIIDGTVPPGDYYFIIANDDTIFLTSNQIQVVKTTSDYRNYTARVTFTHDRYFYGVNYQNLTTFSQQFRLHLNKIELQEETDSDVYNEVTTGKQRTFNAFMKLPIRVEAYYFDQEAHKAAIVMFGHSSLYVNGKEYTKKGAYKINTNVLTKTSKGEIELYDQEFATANRCLSIPDVEEPGNCIAVVIPDAADLPDGEVNVFYSYSFDLTGDLPITMSVISKPAWMNIALVDSTLTFSGTPSVESTSVLISLSFTNCETNPTLFSNYINISNPASLENYFTATTFVSGDADTEVEIANLYGVPGCTVTIELDNYVNSVGGKILVNSSEAFLSNTWNVVLDGSGIGALNVAIDNTLGGPGPGAILGHFTITAVTMGTIGSPNSYQISKAFI